MKEEELLQLTIRISDKVTNAVAVDDGEEALFWSSQLAKEFTPMYKNLINTIGGLLEFLYSISRENQETAAREIEQAIREKAIAKALEKLEERKRRHAIIHDLGYELITMILSGIARAFGEEYLYRALCHAGEQKRKWFDKMTSQPVGELVKESARIFRSHLGNFRIEEDSTKFTFTLEPCGSGGRLCQAGAYTEPKPYYLIKKPCPMTLKQSGFPAYCAHCVVWNSLLPIEWFGYPLWVHEPPDKETGSCKFHIYKNPKDVPEEYYRLLDRERP